MEARSQIDTALRLDLGARARIDEGAATGRQHMRRLAEQPCDDAPLAVPEILLAETLEYLCDAAAGGRFDLGIGVAERHAQPGGEAPPDRTLARAHHADERNRAFQLVHRPSNTRPSGIPPDRLA